MIVGITSALSQLVNPHATARCSHFPLMNFLIFGCFFLLENGFRSIWVVDNLFFKVMLKFWAYHGSVLYD